MTGPTPDHEGMDSFAEVAELLFGDGAYELVAKMNPTSSDLSTKKRQRRQAQVGLASNVIGLGAGIAGTAEAHQKFKEARLRSGKVKAPKMPKPPGGGKFAEGIRVAGGKLGKIKTKHVVGLAAAGLGLQVANVAGDAIANRVLARSAADPKKKVAKSQEMDIVWEGEFAKFDTDKRQVFGWASIVELNGEPVVDLQGDYISADEIEKAAYSYVEKSRKGGDMHRREGEDAFHASEMIESFMVTPEKVEKMGLPPGSLPTGWWVGYRIHDDETWNLVKSGKRSGFSIHGRGKRVEQD